MADDLGRVPIPGVAGARGRRHPTRLLTPISSRKRGELRQVDGARFIPAATARLNVRAAPAFDRKNTIPIGVRYLLDGTHLLFCDAAGIVDQQIDRAVFCSIRAIHAAAAARSVRSSTSVSTPAPAVSTSSVADRSQPNTHAPSSAKVSAMQRPNRCPAPVTTTVFPSNRIRIGRTFVVS